MAKYRAISLNFWTDAKIADDFTPEDRYFYLYLFTNPHTNLCGCYEISLRQMVNETGYSKDTIERLIDRFKNFHKVVGYSPETKEVLLINWHKYNWTSSEKFRKPLGEEIKCIKNESFREYLSKLFEGEDVGYGIDTPCIDTTVSVSVSDSVNINNNSNNNINNIYNAHFQDFWDAYPRKVDKKRAYKCYQARIKEGFSEEEMLHAAQAYSEECKKEHRDSKYIKHPATFLSVDTPFAEYIKKAEPKKDDKFSKLENFYLTQEV